jgi:transposase, IS5 family
MKVGTGTIVDATIISAPSSTKNKDKKRDPEMRQVGKGKNYFFGMKLHIGVDSHWGLAHSAVVTSAKMYTTGTRCPTCCAARSSRSMETARMLASKI